MKTNFLLQNAMQNLTFALSCYNSLFHEDFQILKSLSFVC